MGDTWWRDEGCAVDPQGRCGWAAWSEWQSELGALSGMAVRCVEIESCTRGDVWVHVPALDFCISQEEQPEASVMSVRCQALNPPEKERGRPV